MNDTRLQRHLKFIKEDLEEDIYIGELEKRKKDSENNKYETEEMIRLQNKALEISKVNHDIEVESLNQDFLDLKHQLRADELFHTDQIKRLNHEKEISLLLSKNKLITAEISYSEKIQKLKKDINERELILKEYRQNLNKQEETLSNLKELNVVNHKENQFKQDLIGRIEKLNSLKEEYRSKQRQSLDFYSNILDLKNKNELSQIEIARKNALFEHTEQRLQLENKIEKSEVSLDDLKKKKPSNVKLYGKKDRPIQPFKYFRMLMREDLACSHQRTIYDLYDIWMAKTKKSEEELIQLGIDDPLELRGSIDSFIAYISRKFPNRRIR